MPNKAPNFKIPSTNSKLLELKKIKSRNIKQNSAYVKIYETRNDIKLKILVYFVEMIIFMRKNVLLK